MSAIALITEPFGYEFMTRALLTALIASAVCAVLSCWLVLIGWSLMGDAVSHAVLPGVALAALAGLPYSAGAIVSAFAAVGMIGVVRSGRRVKEDAAIGIVFTTFFALGLVLISVIPSQTDLVHIVFGNLLGLSWADVAQVAALGLIAGAAAIYKRRDFTLYAFDPGHAHAIGISPRALGAALLALLALTAVAALQAVGVILVVAMLIIPGASARLVTGRLSRMLIIAPALSAGCAAGGLIASYYLDASPAGLIVLAQGAAFGLIFLLAPARGVLPVRWRARRLAAA